MQTRSLEKGCVYDPNILKSWFGKGYDGGSLVFAEAPERDGWILDDGELFLVHGTESSKHYSDASENRPDRAVWLFAATQDMTGGYRYLGYATPAGMQSAVEIRTLAGAVVRASGNAYRMPMDAVFRLTIHSDTDVQPPNRKFNVDGLKKLLALLTPRGLGMLSGSVWFSGSESLESFGEQLWQSVGSSVLVPAHSFRAGDEPSISAFIIFDAGGVYSLPIDVLISENYVAVTFDEFFDLLDPGLELATDRRGRILPFECMFSVFLVGEEAARMESIPPVDSAPGGAMETKKEPALEPEPVS